MATDTLLVVSSSLYTGSVIDPIAPSLGASASWFAVTASMLGANAPNFINISSSYYTGSYAVLFTGSQGASASWGPVTGSMLGGLGYQTMLVNFQTLTSSGGGGGSFTAVTYVLSGYYIAGASRETWSGPSINTPPPTGHTLVDVTVMGSYPPQNSAT